ncbi:MAG: Gfo/Idh/MocA family oxidoreductase [Planctomycetaceae bacterium]|nr:Gfo/Idh/MocA family oxidoreductase [Planctomycetaceae bacterium]
MTLRIGLLGAGWFGREAHLKNLLRLSGVEVAAVSSRSSESRDVARSLVGDSLQTFENWSDVLQVRDLDAVIVALTNDRHHEAAMAAFAAGKHVLCEKPLGLTIKQCDDIIAAAQTANRILQVGHEMRHQALYQKMHAMIRQGAVGDGRIMWCREYRGPMRPGWRSSEMQTGGMLLEKNCHHFDLFNWMFDAKPLRVMAFGGKDVLTDRELLDNAQVLVEFEGSRRAILEICLFAPAGGDCEIGIVGSQGRIDTWNQALRLSYHQFEPRQHAEELVPDADDEAGFRDASGRVDRGIKAELAHFVECCRTGQQPLNNGNAARLNVAVCLAAQESIRRGEVVTLDEILTAS